MADPVKKILTAAQANALIPQVSLLVRQLQGIQDSVLKTSGELNDLVGKLRQGNGNPIESIKSELKELTKHQLQLAEAFQSALRVLEDMGAELKDLRMGVVDFRGSLNGEVIFLCWRLGEGGVQFWHNIEGGFNDRKPLGSF